MKPIALVVLLAQAASAGLIVSPNSGAPVGLGGAGAAAGAVPSAGVGDSLAPANLTLGNEAPRLEALHLPPEAQAPSVLPSLSGTLQPSALPPAALSESPSAAGVPTIHSPAPLDSPAALPAASPSAAAKEGPDAPFSFPQAHEAVASVAGDARVRSAGDGRAPAAGPLFDGAAPDAVAQEEAPMPPAAKEAVAAMKPYIFAQLAVWAEEASAAGKKVINLGQGSPNLRAPASALKAAQEALGRTKNHTYPQAKGSPEFRRAVADWYEQRYGVRLDPDKEVLALLGSKEGIGHLLLAMLEPDRPGQPKDVVLVPDPAYPAYASQLKVLQGHSIPMTMSEAGGYLPDFDALEGQVAEARARGERVRAMILNYPSNPTGAVAPDLQFLEKARAFARRNGIWILYDNAYSDIVFDENQALTMLQVPRAKENTIEFFTFSKNWSMAGFRVAFAVGSAEAVGALAKVKGYFDYGVPPFIQAAAIAALKASASYVPKARRVYESRRNVLVGAMRRIGWDVTAPAGAMYVWAKLPEAAGGMTSVQFVERLIREQGVVVSPGSAFSREGYVRISLVQSQRRLREAVRRIGLFLESLRK